MSGVGPATALALGALVAVPVRQGDEGGASERELRVLRVAGLQQARHLEDERAVADAGVLTTILVASIFLAVRVESERDARQHAEATSRRLTLLNDVGAVLARSRQLPGLLQELVDAVRAGIALDLVCVYYKTEPADAEPLLIVSGDGGSLPRLRALAARAAAGGGQPAAPALVPAGWVAVPLVAEQRSFGVLAGAREDRPLTTAERQVLAIVGREASVALDNLWLGVLSREVGDTADRR